MTGRKITIWIAAAALALAVVAGALLQKNTPAAPEAPAAEKQESQRPADAMPAKVQEAPQRSRDVFIPPVTDATGSSKVNE